MPQRLWCAVVPRPLIAMLAWLPAQGEPVCMEWMRAGFRRWLNAFVQTSRQTTRDRI